MDSTTIYIVIALAVIIIILIVYNNSNKQPEPPKKTIMDCYTPEGQIWVKRLTYLYDNGLTFEEPSTTEFEKVTGITLQPNEYGHKIVTPEIVGYKRNYLDFPETSEEYRVGDFYSSLELDLYLRYYAEYTPLSFQTEEEVLNKYNLNLETGEVLYHHSYTIDWYEEKTVATNIAYNGFRIKSGSGVSFNTGSYTVVKNDIVRFALIDRGDFYITNKRVIFIGKQNRQNRSIKIDDILEISAYKDGILLGKSSGKKPLIMVPAYVNSLLPRNDLHIINRVIYRLMSNTQNQKLK